ncbi:TetR/AcrR family transcriptional regulator [Hydrotalea sp.]|uniref:TetR/AcrR family transcriptional regulator n=1 Tax=Hydrotalea sp. TaxID=2881279 RepID=UPI0026375CF6|nr:TetR/AcrR family transcriptional regulator [Hydrotalea sp.]
MWLTKQTTFVLHSSVSFTIHLKKYQKNDRNFDYIKSFHSFAPIMENDERIIAKAHELFMRYGVRSISMDEIASQLGMSKKTLYQFFADKDHLVEQVIRLEINKNTDSCQLQYQQSENAIHEVFLAIEMVEEMLKNMNPLLLFELEKYHPKAFQQFYEHKNKFLYQIITNNLKRGIEEELYRTELPIEIMAAYRIESIFLIFNPAFNQATGRHSLDELAEAITHHFLYGIATPKGQKLIAKYIQKQPKTSSIN